MKKTLAVILVLTMALTMVTAGLTVYGQIPETSDLPLSQNFDSDTFDAAVTSSGYENVENGNFRMYSNDTGSWKAVSDVAGMTGKSGEIKNNTAGKLTVVQRNFAKQTTGKVMVSFDAMVTAGTFHVYLNDAPSGIHYGSGSSKTDINVLNFDSSNYFSAQAGAYEIDGAGTWVENKTYHVDVIFDIDKSKTYTTIDGNTITIADVKGAKSGMISLGSVSFKSMGESSCAYIDNLEVKAFESSTQILAGGVELTDNAVNVSGINTVDIRTVGVDEATLANAKLYDLGTNAIVKTQTAIALTTAATTDGATLSFTGGFETGKFYQLDLTGVKTFYGEPLAEEPTNFKCIESTTVEIKHDFKDKATTANPTNGGVLDTAITAIAPDGKSGIVSIDNVTGNEGIEDGYALRLGDYTAVDGYVETDDKTVEDTNKANYRGKYGFAHSLKDNSFNIDTTQGGKLTIDLEFINKTRASNDGRYDLYITDGENPLHLFGQAGGTALITTTTDSVDGNVEKAYLITDKSTPNTLNLVLDFDNGEMTVNFTANRLAAPISTTVDYNFRSDSEEIGNFTGVTILTGSTGTHGGYFDHINLKYENASTEVTASEFRNYKNEKVYAYTGGTIPASTKSLELGFSAALTDEEIAAISVKDSSGEEVGAGNYDSATNKYTITFDNYLAPNSKYTISVLDKEETVTTDAGNFEILGREFSVAGGKATLTIKLVNTTGTAQKFIAAIASYENDGLMLNGINVQEITADDSTDKTVELTLGAYDKVKGYVWSGIDTMQPIFPSIEPAAAE